MDDKRIKILKICGWVLIFIIMLFFFMKQGENKYKHRQNVEKQFNELMKK